MQTNLQLLLQNSTVANNGTKQISIRLSHTQHAAIDALVEKTKLNKNKVISDLITIALNAL